MKTAIILITDKPFASRCLLPRARLRWPDQTLYAIPTLYVGRYAFKYPRGLRYADIPFVAAPEWQTRDDITSSILCLRAGNDAVVAYQQTALREQDAIAVLLAGGNEIIYAGDPSYSGAVAYHVLLENVLGTDAAKQPRPCVAPFAMDDASIDAALLSGETTASQRFQLWLNAGLARRYFDFNFNVNAQFLFRSVLRLLHVPHSDTGVSKFGLQVLYRAQTLNPVREDHLLEAMANWRGAGNRTATTTLGSPASQGTIVAQLRALGMLEELEGSGGVRYLRVSALGAAFLSELHPDSEDADLPFRLERWATEWPTSQASIDRYIRTFFGKQKRYAQQRH